MSSDHNCPLAWWPWPFTLKVVS